MMALLIPFAAYYVILFVACFLVVNQGQDTLYDEPPPNAAAKVALGTLPLAAMLTYSKSSFATMFTDEIGTTVLQAILWFGVFALIFRFHPWHAFGISLATMLIVTGLATMGYQSMMTKPSTERFETKAIAPPVRRPTFGGARTATPAPAPAPPAAPAKK